MSDGALSGRQVLLVEDHYLVAEEFRLALAGAGATVLGPAGEVGEALALIERSNRPDAAVIDLHLHGEPAFAIADALARLQVPMLFTTGYSAEDLPEQYRAVPVCRKPLRAADLVRFVAHLL